MKIDLHIHTTYSDGMFSPEKVVDAAIDAGLDAIALTDHDNILSHAPAIAYANELAQKNGTKPLEIIPGVEINTLYNNFAGNYQNN